MAPLELLLQITSNFFNSPFLTPHLRSIFVCVPYLYNIVPSSFAGASAIVPCSAMPTHAFSTDSQ